MKKIERNIEENNQMLYEWLKYEWKLSNHPKYQKYFFIWYLNLTNDQLIGFNNMKTASNKIIKL